MKNFVLAASLTAMLTAFAGTSFTEVVNALKSGNAAEVAKYFDNTVEITLPDKGSSYSKSQAELVLRDFFTSNPVKNFEVIHKSENSGSQYVIGSLTTNNGNFRTTIYLKQKGDKQLVQELRFER